jgi:hypothetical protein
LPGGVRRARDCFGGAAAGRLGPQAIVSEARVSLDEARKTQSDPRTAVGHYLDAADASVRSVGLSSGSEVTEEARSIYNAASQEVAVLLRSSPELWNRTETIPSREGSYRLRFTAGSKKEGTWDPAPQASTRKGRAPGGAD